MPKVVIVGSINIDILSTMQRAPRPGETVNGDTVAFMPGGKGLNQAVACALQNVETAFVGRVGQDAFGDQVLAFFNERGIDASGIVRTATQPTGNAIIFVDSKAENCIVVIPAANREVCPEDAAGVEFAPGDVVASQFEVPRTTIAAVFARARKAGAVTVLNAAPALDDAPDALWLDTDILVVNETELGHFAGVDVAADAPVAEVGNVARRLIRRQGQTVIATLGGRGAVAITEAGEVLVPGRKVKAVDTTGAGDCFVGALCARLSAGDGIADAMRYAGVAASISVTRIGTSTSMPAAGEVRAELG